VSPKGQPATGRPAVRLSTFPLDAGTGFSSHTHDQHQVAWASEGVLIVGTDTGTWVLPPTRALWIPAGVAHDIQASVRATFRPFYVEPIRCPISWDVPQPVTASRLLAELIDRLADPALGADQRSRTEALMYDLLEPAEQRSIELSMPIDPRALDVATALIADPADERDLAAWGHAVGASSRTLARAFLSDTGIGFQRWRTLLRLRAALPHLAAGETIAAIATKTGYQTPSAFVAAFRREIGATPGAYFKPST
jgi:AraC-like DNA-binding protein